MEYLDFKNDFVSVIIPCLNEEKNIENLLEAIYKQSFPIENVEVIIVDGGSTDLTKEKIGSFIQEHFDIKIILISNIKKIIPAALNLGINASNYDFIIRMDAHSIPKKDYIERCVANLKAGIADNVGGLWLIKPASNRLFSRSIAFAASHPFGVGDAKYRYSNEPAFVDTVPYGAYRKEIFKNIGLFNETLLANEDYELNSRIIKNGGKIYFDPKIQTYYIARENLKALWKQYFNYGFWKLQMLRENPKTIKIRQIIPPVFVLSLVLGSIIASFLVTFRLILVLEMGLYFLLLIISSMKFVYQKKDIGLLIGIPLSIMVMHLSWGFGFIFSALKTIFLK